MNLTSLVHKSRHSTPQLRSLLASLVILTASSVPVTLALSSHPAAADTLQMSSDSLDTGWYPNEPLLTPANVSGGNFGELFDTQLTGAVYAQPLVVQPTVLAVTEADYAYGLNAVTGAITWQDSFGPPADPLAQIGCGDIGSQMGITGTPVIDPTTDTAYFVAAEATGTNGATQDFLEAANVQTGLPPANWPAGGVPIQGAADSDPNTVFNAEYETQRAGLVLVNGVVYAAFGSQCDLGTYEGWLVGISTTSATITTMWSSEEGLDGSGSGGIWQSGAAPVVNAQGDIFVATGNGAIPDTPEPGSDTAVTNYGEAVVELSTASGILTPIDFFIAADAAALNAQDGDLGSGGPVALPASMGSTEEPNVMLEVGKQGILYALNMDDLGGYQQGPEGTDDVASENGPYGGVWSKPAVWPGDGGYVYYPTAGTVGFAENGGSLNAFQRSVSSSGVVSFQLAGATANSGNTFGYGSGTPIVTSTGTTSGSALVWIIHANNSSGANSQLEAFNPVPTNPGASGTLEEEWQSAPFTSTVFSSPGVDNGVVYVGTKDDSLLGFGALTAPVPALTTSSVNFPSTIVSQTAVATATFTASAPTTVTSFASSGASFSLGTPSQSLPASLTAGQSITVPITFTPQSLGSNTGTITANGTGATTSANLLGQGTTSTNTLSSSPTTITFAPQPIGGPVVTQQVTFTNISGAPINVTGFKSPSSPFSVTSTPAKGTLGIGDSLSFNVNFAPPGSSGDFLHLFNSVATLDTSAGNFGVAISATASPPAQITTIPNTLNFGDVSDGASSTLNFDLGDQGGFPLTILSTTPPSSNGFSATTTLTAGTVIAANTSVQESVQFTPAANGPVTATWLIEGNDGSGPQTITLTGTGTGFPVPTTTTSTTTTTTIPPTTTTTTAPSGGGGSPPPTTTTTTTTTTSTTTTIPRTTTTTTQPKQPPSQTVSVGFAVGSSTLTPQAKKVLLALSKKIAAIALITCTGYAYHNEPLAKARALAIASYLTAHVNILTTIKVVTTVAANKATVRT